MTNGVKPFRGGLCNEVENQEIITQALICDSHLFDDLSMALLRKSDYF